MNNFTKKQLEIIKEINLINGNTGFDLGLTIGSTKDRQLVTNSLIIFKDRLIRSEVIFDYTAIDEYFNAIIYDHFFWNKGRALKKRDFEIFNNSILNKLSTLYKLDIVKSIIKPSKELVSFVHTVNDLRNILAHNLNPAFYNKKPTYKGCDIYSTKGFNLYRDDALKVIFALHEKANKVKILINKKTGQIKEGKRRKR